MVTDSRTPLRPGALRALDEPRPLAVRVRSGWEDEAVPVAVSEERPRRRASPRRWQRVERVIEDWLICDEWWRSMPVHRHYFRLALADGVMLTMYQDLTDGRWYRQPY